MISDKSKKIIRKRGIVVSDKMEKTVVVAVSDLRSHKKYKKKYISTKRYKVHDENNKFKVGDEAEIIPTKLISKDKFYKVL